uniref:Uncharacterized protein n=1 Tax=Myoviridae sp. ctj3P51 TaxID=2826687 RepID=A0A8S5NQ73_9CAUD|nr:MAG TPA: hypothetical protein [Myoviridae sp. ctj3P51]
MKPSFKNPSSELRNAYESTLYRTANARDKKDMFYCGMLRCMEGQCPFASCGSCSDETGVESAGYKRTFAEWQEWWYKLTGTKDPRPESMFIDDSQTETINDSNYEEPTESFEFSQEILINIRWNLVDGIEIKKRIRIEELAAEVKRFHTELDAWLMEMSKPINEVNVRFTNRMHFEACTVKLGKCIVEYDFNSQMFGKRKVWAEL